MYLQDELLMATPLALYIGWRVYSLIKPGALKIAWVVFFIVMAAGYPVAESLSHGTGDGLAEAIILIGYCALPLLLYVVMAVVATDLVFGVLRLAGAVSREAARSPRVRRVRLALGLALPVLVVVFGIVNHRVLRVREYRINLARRSSTAGRLTVVFMADLHFRSMTSDRFLDELVAKVNAQAPDVILIGGDILEGDRRDEDIGRYARAFRRMNSRYGIFAVPGNHERFARSGGGAFFDQAAIRLLQDEVVPVDQAFNLIGRRDERSRSQTPLATLVASAGGELPVVVLVHRPSDFDKASRSGVAVQLAGHTHHGQLFPANFVTSREYPLSRGHVERDGTHHIVTSGVQGWGPPVRTVGASEIIVLRLAFLD